MLGTRGPSWFRRISKTFFLFPNRDGLHPKSNGLQPNSDGLHPSSFFLLVVMASNLIVMVPVGPLITRGDHSGSLWWTAGRSFRRHCPAPGLAGQIYPCWEECWKDLHRFGDSFSVGERDFRSRIMEDYKDLLPPNDPCLPGKKQLL